jgi:trehalose-phosphatase
VPIDSLPDALVHWDAAEATLAGREPAVFLDYDGTLTPIVERPEDAVLAPEMRERIRRLAERCLVALVSGRDVGFVVEQVALDSASSFSEVTGSMWWSRPAASCSRTGSGSSKRSSARSRLPRPRSPRRCRRITGARIERKKYAIAVHYRQVAEEEVAAVEAAVDEVLARHAELRKTGGKKVFELRPDIDWDKGRALLWVLEALGMDGDTYAPVYIGDDLTDEDAFAVLRGNGLGIAVGSEDRLTLAGFSVPDTDAAGEVLARLVAYAEGERQ